MFKKGFTLIELLVVIAVMAVIAAAVLVGIDPVDKLNAANDSKSQADIGQVATASVAFAASHSGFFAPDMDTLKSEGELTNVPVAATGYTYTYAASPGSCTSSTCTSVVITSTLKSKKYVTPGYTTWRYDSTTGVTCAWNGTACKP